MESGLNCIVCCTRPTENPYPVQKTRTTIIPTRIVLRNHFGTLLETSSLRRVKYQRQNRIAATAAGRKRKLVNCVSSAKAAAPPRSKLARTVGVCSQQVKANSAANCVHAVGISVYANPENARTVGSVENNPTARNAAKSPNSRRVHTNTSATVKRKNGKTPRRASVKLR